jgi:hypothetical protein
MKVIAIVRPETLVRWHRGGFRLYWRWKSRSRGGRLQVELNLRVLIRRMSIENPLLGAPRIHGELLKLGSIQCYEIHGEASCTTKPGMAHLSAESCAGCRCHGLVHCPDHWLRPTLCIRHCRLDRRDLVWINRSLFASRTRPCILRRKMIN